MNSMPRWALVLSLVLLCTVPQSAQQCTQIPPNAVAWWPGEGVGDERFENRLSDEHHAQDATPQESPFVQFSPGMVGQAWDFSDGEAHARVAAHPDLDFVATDEYSILMWMKSLPVNDNGNLALVTKYRDWNFPYPYAVRIKTSLFSSPGPDDGEIWAGCTDTIRYGTTQTTRRFDDGVFHHIAAVYRHSVKTVEIHADGGVSARRVYPEDLSGLANGGDLWFGRSWIGSTTAYDGLLDDIMIFDRALSVCETRRIHEAGSAGICRTDDDLDGLNDYEDNCPAITNAMQVDTDADGHGDPCDCAPLNPNYAAVPPEVCLLTVERDGTGTKLSWPTMEIEGGSGVRYDVLSGSLDELGGVGPSESCLDDDLDALETVHAYVPPPGTGIWYLVRADSQCGNGSWGFATAGERSSLNCS